MIHPTQIHAQTKTCFAQKLCEISNQTRLGKEENVMKTTRLIPVAIALLTLALVASCGKTGGDRLVGEWVDVEYPSRYAIVTKRGDAYTWEDNEGKYPAVYKDEMLKISTGFGEAVAFYDEETGYMILQYMGLESKFKRK